MSCTTPPSVFNIQGDGVREHSLIFDFIAETQNPSIHDSRFEEFTIPSLYDFMGGDRDELLLFPNRALRKYISRTEQYCPGISNLFASTTKRKKQVS